MVEENDRDRSAKRSWLADAFDPVENLRALADAQEFGRRAAEELADRVLARRDGMPGDAAGSDDDLSELVRRFRSDAVRAGDLWANLIDNVATVVGILGNRLPRRPDTDAEAGSVVLKPVLAGAGTTGLFWIHNTSAAAVSPVRPHCAAPRSHLGDELPPDAIRFDPQVLDPLPPRSSCGIEVRLAVPRATPPGTYQSVILATNVPHLCLPLRVTVKGEGAEA